MNFCENKKSALHLQCRAVAPKGIFWYNADKALPYGRRLSPFTTEGVMLFTPSNRGGDAVEYITLILIIVLYTIIEIKK